MTTKEDEERRQWARAAQQQPVSEATRRRRLEAQKEAAWLFPLAMKELAGSEENEDPPAP